MNWQNCLGIVMFIPLACLGVGLLWYCGPWLLGLFAALTYMGLMTYLLEYDEPKEKE